MRSQILNLMVKDLRALRSERTLAVTAIVLLIVSIAMSASPTAVSLVYTVFALSMCVLNVFSIDEKYHAEQFFASLPVRRRDIVMARYVEILVLTVAYLVLAFLANTVYVVSGNPFANPLRIGYCAVLVAAMSLYSAISLPFYFRLGVMKARIITMVLLFVPMVVGGLLVGLRSGNGFNPFDTRPLARSWGLPPLDVQMSGIVMGAALALCLSTIPVSMRFYARRDL